MYNIYEYRAFKVSFEDCYRIYEIEVSRRPIWKRRMSVSSIDSLRNVWEYFEEGKIKQELELLMSCYSADYKSKSEEIQWALAMQLKHHQFGQIPTIFKGMYDRFVRYEREWLEMEEMYWDSLIFT